MNRNYTKPEWEPDILAEVYLIPTSKGDRSTPAQSGYRPTHQVKEDYLTSGAHFYLDNNKIEPGKRGKALIKFIAPEKYPKCLWINRTINATEGSRVIAKVTVLEVYNDILDREK